MTGLLLTVTDDVLTTCSMVKVRVKVSCLSSVYGSTIWFLTSLANQVMVILVIYLIMLRNARDKEKDNCGKNLPGV